MIKLLSHFAILLLRGFVDDAAGTDAPVFKQGENELFGTLNLCGRVFRAGKQLVGGELIFAEPAKTVRIAERESQ